MPTDTETAQAIARLGKETLEEWTIRFHRERGLPIPSEKELAILIRLSDADQSTGHQ